MFFSPLSKLIFKYWVRCVCQQPEEKYYHLSWFYVADEKTKQKQHFFSANFFFFLFLGSDTDRTKHMTRMWKKKHFIVKVF